MMLLKLLVSGEFYIGIIFGIMLGFVFAPLIKSAKARLAEYIKSIW